MQRSRRSASATALAVLPSLVSVRFLFLRYPKGFACVPVKNNGFEKSKVVNPSYDRK